MSKLVLALGLISVATPALAADPGVVNYSEAFDWNGLYAGIQVGGQNVDVTTLNANEIQPSGSGFLAGVHAGYNHQIDQLVFGVEGDVEYSSFDASTACFNAAWTCTTNLAWQGSARARVGYAADAIMFYLTGGVAVAHIGGSTINAVPTTFSDSSTRVGYTVGGGIEAALADNLTGVIQYRYSNYGTRDMTYDSVYDAVGVTTHAITAGLSYHFD